jgi:NAD(P)-dependent dehydrogenase (short-subunit alcohol dehydrogenase family)
MPITPSASADAMVAALPLAGQVLLVTGASSGIGRAFARHAAKAGASVVLCARNKAGLDRCVADIGEAGGRALSVATDVAREADVIAAFDAAIARFGRIDGVVAAAGINVAGSATHIAAQDVDDILSVNIRGMLLTAREGARRMIAQGERDGGVYKILLVGSATGLREGVGAMPRLTTYSASKAAVDMLGKSLAGEWARSGINVNVVHPGVIRTEMNAEWLESSKGRAFLSGFPRPRAIDVEQVLPLMLFLMSAAGDPITGGQFLIDDGQTL